MDEEKLERVARAVQGKDSVVTPKQIAEETKLSKAKVAKAIQRLEDAGAVTANSEGGITAAQNAIDAFEAAHTAGEENKRRHEAELKRMEEMVAFAEALSCRRAHVLRYFGEEIGPECGNCDHCLSASSVSGGTRREVS